MSRLKELESKLTVQQRKAALLLVENDVIAAASGEKKSQEEIAKEVGVDRITTYRWRHQNATFIEYMNLLADDMLSSHRAGVYGQLLKLINGKQPSVKAIDLFMKRYGLLTEKVQTTTGSTEPSSNADIEKEIAELGEILGEKEE
ncbi:phBC6A51 family helix-turn-helix protein [Bacillus subtilis]|uniref:phBC6A51 family helix-turn-helix protein n=1 Tax=Bacillus subtilis TaxID=1423 RepID=UPI00240D8687|nr:phBC6A51 family helix-turn-helix protein [Bacillus subtilis]WEZ19126.1 phBC6A51 family helix-turn-helix protein [Bacillus subtilis]